MNVRTTRLSALCMPLFLFAAPAVLVPETGWSQTLEEITVTARRREESLQDVPVAVASFGADFVDKQGIVSTRDVVKLVPGVQFDQGFAASDTRISIRGINSSRGRASVAVLVDGVDVSGESVSIGGGSSLLNTSVLDIERIEVVKGPQSALYGRSAFAGAVNYITRQPNMEENEISFGGDIASHDTSSIKGRVSGPIIANTLALSFNAATQYSDGYYNNPVTGEDLNGYQSTGFKLAALWTPTDNLSITPALTWSKDESDPRAIAKVGKANTFYDANGNVLQGITDPGTPGIAYGNWLGKVGSSVQESDINLSGSEFYNGDFPGSEDRRMLLSLNLDWDLGATTFKSITSYLHNNGDIAEDVDYQNGLGSPRPDLGGVQASIANEFIDDTTTKQFNQELTLESNNTEGWSWLGGVQYYQEHVDNADNSQGWFNDPNWSLSGFCGTDPFFVSCNIGQSISGGTPIKNTRRKTESYSVFGLVSFDLTDKLTATLEGRYIHDKIDVSTNTLIDRVNQYFFHLPADLGQPQLLPATGRQTTDEFNPRGTLDYSLTEEVMFYGSVAKGTKPGGFGTAQFSRPEFSETKTEKLWAYELGTKTSWLDGSFIANGAIFYNDYDDRQVGITVQDLVNPFGFPASGIANAGGADIKGLEVELNWMPLESLTLGLGYAYTDAEWDDFKYENIREDGIATAKDKAICGNQQGDCSNANVAGIPENALSLIADFRSPLFDTGLDFFANTVAQWEDERPLSDQKRTAYVDDYWRVDAQLGVETDVWSLMLYATNVFDDDTVIWSQNYFDFLDGMYGANGGPRDESIMGFLPEPRIVGLRGTWKYGN